MNFPMKSPLAGSPPTVQTTDQAGRLQFRVTPCELTPLGARLADITSGLMSLALAAGSALTLIDWHQPELPQMAAVVGVSLIGGWVLRWTAQKAFRVSTVIEIGMDTIRVRRLMRWQSYDRRPDHFFALQTHDYAEYERRRNDLATRKAAANSRVVQKPVYYGDSFHVVFVQEGQRIDLLTVFGRQPASAIVARLQYCDRLLEREAKRVGSGCTISPEDEWLKSPGGL